jgi:hypothetical protein
VFTMVAKQGDLDGNLPTFRNMLTSFRSPPDESPQPSQPQIPNTVPSSTLENIFQKCFMSHMNPIVRNTLNPMDIAFMEKVAIQNITGNVTGKTYGMEITIKPIIDCMKQEQQTTISTTAISTTTTILISVISTAQQQLSPAENSVSECIY